MKVVGFNCKRCASFITNNRICPVCGKHNPRPE